MISVKEEGWKDSQQKLLYDGKVFWMDSPQPKLTRQELNQTHWASIHTSKGQQKKKVWTKQVKEAAKWALTKQTSVS